MRREIKIAPNSSMPSNYVQIYRENGCYFLGLTSTFEDATYVLIEDLGGELIELNLGHYDIRFLDNGGEDEKR